MEIIIQQRGHGKTKRLIEEAAKHGYYIICRNQNECSRIAAVAKELGHNIPFPLSYSEFHNHEYFGRGVKGFLLDQADDYLQWITRVPIMAVTMTDTSSAKEG